ncbi:MAG: YjgN family protein [Sphingorhabdus sp.]
MSDTEGRAPSAVKFHGSWTDFARIALPNVLLTLVTLGFYRFWATTRERQYLWAHTSFIDEPLEWTGRGIELFIGFVMVFFLVVIPIVVIQFILQGFLLQGQPLIAGLIVFALFMLILYLSGVAYFRALRYRLSRTYWRGIRGGSDDPGFSYGWSYIWKNFVGAIVLYLLYPWASMSLWNERWNKMSFGPYRFESTARWQSLMKRYLLFYLVPFLVFVGGAIAGFAAIGAQTSGQADSLSTAGGVFGVGLVIIAVLGLYIIMPIAALLYYSKFMRVAISALKLGDLEFEFTARSPDWILFWLANMAIFAIAYAVAIIPFSLLIATDPAQLAQQMQAGESILGIGTGIALLLAIIPLGLATSLIRYRSWKFFVVHTEAFGEVNLDRMTQSDTQTSGHGEGLLDAFDVGAI